MALLALASTVGCASAPAPSSSTSTTYATLPAAQRATVSPTRPEGVRAPPLADPPLQQPTLHLTVSHEGLAALLDALVIREDTGAFALLGARTWQWRRAPFALAFDDAQKTITATTDVSATIDIPGTTLSVPLRVRASVQPVLSAHHAIVLQAVQVRVDSDDRRVRFADLTAGLVRRVEDTLRERLASLSIDLAPTLQVVADQLAEPVFLPLHGASACFTLDVRGVQAGPTILADGLEKQLALTIAPSLTMPCAARDDGGALVVVDPSAVAPAASLAHEAAPPADGRAAPGGTPTTKPAAPRSARLPPLQNASSIEGGPFTLRVPVAASYHELRRALLGLFPGGRLRVSDDEPDLYVTEPEVFAADGAIVVRLRLGGFVDHGVHIAVDGDLYLTGRPAVRDNFLEVIGLRPTLATEQALLQVALALKERELVATLERALRVDLSARLDGVKERLAAALSVQRTLVEGVGPLCTRAELGRLAIDDVAAHDPYLRATVSTTALLAASLPCPGQPAVVPLPPPPSEAPATAAAAPASAPAHAPQEP